jgi:hypothetical protein
MSYLSAAWFHALFLGSFLVLSICDVFAAKVNVLTYHNDVARTGLNAEETILTPSNVNSNTFGKIASYPVDGFIYAQPLSLSDVPVPGKGLRDLVYVATEHNSVYAFDANPNPNDSVASSPIWQVSFNDPARGITTVSDEDVTGLGSIVPEIGITSTPVIDPVSSTIYVLAKTKEVGTNSVQFVQRLHALDAASGSEKFGGPVTIEATMPGIGDGTDGRGHVAFDPRRHLNRPGLLLQSGVVYACWASHGDTCPYHGWVIGFDALTLGQRSAFATTPNSGLGGIWQSGAAPASDSAGNVYVITGNGAFNVNTGGVEYGDTFLKLTPTLQVADYFAPFNQLELDAKDDDLGSSGAILLPDEVGNGRQLLVGAGKAGTIYLLDRHSLGGFHATNDSQIVQSLTNAIGPAFGTPAYFNGTIFYAGANDSLKAFALSNGLISAAPQSKSERKLRYPGASPSITAHGTTNGIVWVIERGSEAVLRAFDALDLSRELYNSTQAGSRDKCAAAVKFSVPAISNGKVFVGTQDHLEVFANGRWADTPAISPNGRLYTNEVSVSLSSSIPGAEIHYTIDGSSPTTNSPLYLAPISLTSTAVLRSRAFHEEMIASLEAAAGFTVARSDAPGATAKLLQIDTQSHGSWRGIYGTDGYTMADRGDHSPLYAISTVEGAQMFNFAADLNPEAFLDLPDGSGKTGAAWFSSDLFTLDLNLTDDNLHAIAIYACDPANERAERFDIFDARSGELLDTQTLSNFQSGGYLVWNISGHVRIQVTRTAGANALISGIFFGFKPLVPPPLINPPSGSYAGALEISIANPADATQIRYTVDGSDPSVYSPLLKQPIDLETSALIKARAFAATAQSPIVSRIYDINEPEAGALFLAPDPTTRGNWVGTYGANGYHVFGDAPNYPDRVRVSNSGAQLFLESTVSPDDRASQKAFCPDERIVGLWYARDQFSVDIDLMDRQAQQITFYLWDSSGTRAESIDVIDAWTGRVLDRQQIQNFQDGVYLGWEIAGHVKFVISRREGANAVLNGLFFDPPARPPRLRIQTTGSQTVLSWPAARVGYQLERTLSLDSPFTFLAQPTNTAAIVEITSSAQFFRLRQP